jgi:hypothetical protein
LNKLIEIEEQNFKMKWGEEFLPQPTTTLSSSASTISNMLPRRSGSEKVLPKKEEKDVKA